MIKRFKNFAKKNKIIKFCESQRIVGYEITDDFIINVDGDVDISESELYEIPYRFGKVTGYFDCSKNYLTSLKNCPTEIGDDFRFSENKITSFEFAPKTVGSNMYGEHNLLSSFENMPNVKLNNQLDYNKFKSLNGINIYDYTGDSSMYISLHHNPITYLTTEEYDIISDDSVPFTVIGGWQDFPIEYLLCNISESVNYVDDVYTDRIKNVEVLDRILEFDVIKDTDKIDLLSLESLFEFLDIDKSIIPNIKKIKSYTFING